MNDMPEVKWVEQGDVLGAPDLKEFSELRKNCMIPVLTIDAIEAWLKQSYGTFPDYWSDDRVGGHINAIDDLLAQVQAWKEGTR